MNRFIYLAIASAALGCLHASANSSFTEVQKLVYCSSGTAYTVEMATSNAEAFLTPSLNSPSVRLATSDTEEYEISAPFNVSAPAINVQAVGSQYTITICVTLAK
jgi:hypothetical protein